MRAGENGIFIALDQKPGHVAEAAARFGWPVDSRGPSQTAAPSIFVLDGSPALSLMRQRALDARAVMSDLIPHLRACAARRLVSDALPALVRRPLGTDESDSGAWSRARDNLGVRRWCGPDGTARRALRGVMARLTTGVQATCVRTRRALARYRCHKFAATIVDARDQAFE